MFFSENVQSRSNDEEWDRLVAHIVEWEGAYWSVVGKSEGRQ